MQVSNRPSRLSAANLTKTPFLSFILLISLLASQMLFALTVSAQNEENTNPPDFSKLSRTVQVMAYKYAPIGDAEKFASGSATIIDENGLLLTNEHVVTDGNDEPLDVFNICFTFDPEKEPVCHYAASLLAMNKEMDTALLQLHDTDFKGNKLPKLPFLPYKNDSDIKNGDKMQIIGYPNTGRKTITGTQGQVSGFTYENDIRYIKTDAAVSGGNSGGTALDEKGNFIGVPSFLVSRQDNLTYILDLKAAVKWIDENREKKGTFKEKAKNIVAQRELLLDTAKKNKKYKHPAYPNYEIALAGKWQIDELNKETLSLKNIIQGRETFFNVRIVDQPFKIGKITLDKIFEELDEMHTYLDSYKRIETGFGNLNAHLVTYLSGDWKIFNYYIPYGHSLIIIDYSIDQKNKTESEKIHDELLKTFTVNSAAKNYDKKLENFTLSNPPFSIKTTEGWFLQPAQVGFSGYSALLEFSREDSADSNISMKYDKLSSAEREMKNKEIFDELIKKFESSDYFKILAKDSEVEIGGLKGWSITISFPGKGVEMKKQTQMYLRKGDYFFLISYTDKEKNYNKYIEDFKKIVGSFEYGTPEEVTQNPPPKAKVGTLNTPYKDLDYHRFQNEIENLKEKGYLEDFTKATFAPEKALKRGEALALLIEAKFRFDERKKNLGERDEEKRAELDEYKFDARSSVNFSDTREHFWPNNYIRYAKAKGYIKGGKGKKFYPNRDVTLAELLSMAFKIFEVPVWEPKDTRVPWYKPIMDKGYQKYLIPAGMWDINNKVTRGEFAYMLENLLEVLGDV